MNLMARHIRELSNSGNLILWHLNLEAVHYHPEADWHLLTGWSGVANPRQWLDMLGGSEWSVAGLLW
jgi:hypothetical protein